MKKFHSHDLLFLLIPIALGVASCFAIAGTSEAVSKAYTYNHTDFDVLAFSPSKEQVATYKKDASVKSVLPCYFFAPENVTMLAYDDPTAVQTGFFNDSTLISGDFSGVVVDKKAADNLNVGVGSSISLPLGDNYVTKTVSGVAMPVHFGSSGDFNSKGVVQFYFDQECVTAYGVTPHYGLVFIASNNLAGTEKMLDGYKPYGELETFEEFKADYEKSHKQGSYTDEEWLALEKKAYAEEVAAFEFGTYDGSVQYKEAIDKAGLYSSTSIETVASKKKISLIAGAVGAVVFALFVFFFDLAEKKDLDDDFKQGHSPRKSFFWLFFRHSIIAFGSGLLTFAILLVCANMQVMNFPEFQPLILWTTVLPLAGYLVSIVIDLLFIKRHSVPNAPLLEEHEDETNSSADNASKVEGDSASRIDGKA
jgi:hypothetical protein